MIHARRAPPHRTTVNEQITVRADRQRRFTPRCYDGCAELSAPLPTRPQAERVALAHATAHPEVWVITTLDH